MMVQTIFMERSHMDHKNIIRAQFFSIWSQEWIALGKDTGYYVWTKKPLKSPVSAYHWAWHVVLQPIAVDPGRVQVCGKGFRKDSVKATTQGLLLSWVLATESTVRTCRWSVLYFWRGYFCHPLCLFLPPPLASQAPLGKVERWGAWGHWGGAVTTLFWPLLMVSSLDFQILKGLNLCCM